MNNAFATLNAGTVAFTSTSETGQLSRDTDQNIERVTQAERLARSELEALQLDRLRNLIERIYNKVPFFRQRFEEQNLNAHSLTTLNDLAQFPFSYKADLRDNYPLGLLAVPLSEIVRIHASSGTKGKLTIGGYTQADIELWAQLCMRSLIAAGARPGDIIQNSYGYGLFTGGLGLHYGAEALGATVIPASGGRTRQQVMLLQDLGARVLCATPSYALNIAYTMEELGIAANSTGLEIGIFGAEPWTEGMRKQLELRLGITALDIYGLSEIIGPGVAMECIEGRSGLHIWEDHFYPEIVDPITGEALSEGEEGELVLSSLSREGMPLLRYRTGDITALNYEPCRCGRTMVRMQRVKGRLDDMLIVRGVNLYPSEIETQLLCIEELAPQYQIVISRKKALDQLTVRAELVESLIAFGGPDAYKNNLELDALSGKIADVLKEALGLSVTVELLPPSTLPRSEGKALRVIDKRK
jgi:phenylacetate-CoA ligase